MTHVKNLLLLIPFIENGKFLIAITIPYLKKGAFFLELLWSHTKFSVIAFLVFFIVTFFCKKEVFIHNISESFFTSLVGAIATIFVLMPALSILPIQKASEAWSSEIVRLYRDDRKIRCSLFCTAILVFLCFLLEGMKSLLLEGPSNHLTFLKEKHISKIHMGILFVGICIDLVFYYYNRVCELLLPETACELLVKKAKKVIDINQKKAEKFSREDMSLWKKLKRNKSLDREREFYKNQSKECGKKILHYIEVLGEIGYKSTTRQDYSTVSIVLNSLEEIARHYAQIRNTNFTSDTYGWQVGIGSFDRITDSLLKAVKGICSTPSYFSEKISTNIIKTMRNMCSTFLSISVRHCLYNYKEDDRCFFTFRLIADDDLFEYFNNTQYQSMYYSIFYCINKTMIGMSNLDKFLTYIFIFSRVRKFNLTHDMRHSKNISDFPNIDAFHFILDKNHIPTLEEGDFNDKLSLKKIKRILKDDIVGTQISLLIWTTYLEFVRFKKPAASLIKVIIYNLALLYKNLEENEKFLKIIKELKESAESLNDTELVDYINELAPTK